MDRTELQKEVEKVKNNLDAHMDSTSPCFTDRMRHPGNAILHRKYTYKDSVLALLWPCLMLGGGGLLVGLVKLTQYLAHLSSEVCSKAAGGRLTSTHTEGKLYRLLQRTSVQSPSWHIQCLCCTMPKNTIYKHVTGTNCEPGPLHIKPLTVGFLFVCLFWSEHNFLSYSTTFKCRSDTLISLEIWSQLPNDLREMWNLNPVSDKLRGRRHTHTFQQSKSNDAKLKINWWKRYKIYSKLKSTKFITWF